MISRYETLININNGNADKFDVIYNKYLKIVTDAVNKSR